MHPASTGAGMLRHLPRLEEKIQDIISHLKSSSDVPDMILTLERKIRKYLIKINPWGYIIWLFLQIKFTSCFHCTPVPWLCTNKMLYHISWTLNAEGKKYLENYFSIQLRHVAGNEGLLHKKALVLQWLTRSKWDLYASCTTAGLPLLKKKIKMKMLLFQREHLQNPTIH